MEQRDSITNWWHAQDSKTKAAMEGAIWGAWLGDAAGVVLEFSSEAITPAMVDQALEYPGGGVFSVVPGQISDDGEMTMCLWRAVATTKEPCDLANTVAALYRAWYKSDPFDIGITTVQAVSDPGITAESMRKAADRAQAQSKSESNGCLMRCTPLAVAALKGGWTGDELDMEIRKEVSLTHPSTRAQDAVIAYVRALVHLFKFPGDGAGAMASVESWMGAPQRGAVLKEWWARAQDPTPLTTEEVSNRSMGWIRHAWILAFQHLKAGSSWEVGMKETLVLGGDTDTNACIVGGLLGALHGVDALPRHAMEAVKKPHDLRPLWLQPHAWMNLDMSI